MARFEMSVEQIMALPPVEADAHAYFELGCLYAAGRSGTPDLVVAHKWFNVAAARGHGPAADRRSELAAEMTADEIAAAQRDARAWLTRH